ncbi:MAG: Pr6Pr family membrane protein [Gaiellaceae bacterium]
MLPVVLVADWLLDPPRHRLPLRLAAAWVAFPVAYVIYTLIRGESVDWYPYPFLNVAEHGYGGVIGGSVLLAVGVVPVALALIWLGNGLHGLRGPAPGETLRPRRG